MEQGQGLVEYALILMLIAIVVIIGLAFFGEALTNIYDYAITELINAFTGGASP